MNRRFKISVAAGSAVALGALGLYGSIPGSVAGQGSASPSASQAEQSVRSVDRARASSIGRQAVQRKTGKSARVTGIGREDDFGAKWEVEVTLRNGREFDVYVDRRGRVIKIKPMGFGD
jgi:hypothetical protein